MEKSYHSILNSDYRHVENNIVPHYNKIAEVPEFQ
jgi:hypothetical protein